MNLLTKKDKIVINPILKKVGDYRKKNLPEKMTFKILYGLITREERKFLKKIMRINPKIYGFKGPYYGITPVPQNLIVVKNQIYKRGGRRKIIPPQLVPRKVYSAYLKLNKALENYTSKKLLIESAYRSPAYQLVIFLFYLRFHKWDLKKVIKRVALPGYSEHGYPPRQALDFMTTKGIPTDENPLEFIKTPEYKWLLKNAKKFRFHLSYPQNNPWGVVFEPWHWSYRNRKYT